MRSTSRMHQFKRFTPSVRACALALAITVPTTCALAIAAPGADALTIRGRGYGHGIGMSQYGAYGQARAGIGWQDILKHYYTGTSLVTVSPSPDIRVVLQTQRTVRFTSVADAGGSPLDPAKTYTASISGSEVMIRDAAGSTVARGPSPLTVRGANGQFQLRGRGLQGLRDGIYRGTLQLRINGARLYAINSVALESYVRGVVSAESPASWPADALRAQAVAARTYAITTTAGRSLGFDQWPDTRSQVYSGVAAERPSTDAAVAATSGRVVARNGIPVTTYFFSTSGGYTENVENSFTASRPLDWLRGVADPYDSLSPRHKWTMRLTKSRLNRQLRPYLLGGRFKRIRVLQRGVSPRIVRAEVIGTRGRATVTGAQLRAALGLYDTWASFGGRDIAPRSGDSAPTPLPPAPPPVAPPTIQGGGVQAQ